MNLQFTYNLPVAATTATFVKPQYTKPRLIGTEF